MAETACAINLVSVSNAGRVNSVVIVLLIYGTNVPAKSIFTHGY
jgi:hypothetical protein